MSSLLHRFIKNFTQLNHLRFHYTHLSKASAGSLKFDLLFKLMENVGVLKKKVSLMLT